MGYLVFGTLVFLLLVLLLRWNFGLSFGKTISHDDLTIRSQALGLVGRPDRIVKRGKYYIPEDKKPSYKVYDTYKAQIGVYLILIEEHYGIRPPYGVVVLGNGRRAKIKNTEKLRAWVLDIVEQINNARKTVYAHLEPADRPAKCKKCTQLKNCSISLI